jgi:hypothetical protein
MTDTIQGPTPLDVAEPNKDDLQLWSVTTVLGALHKEGLMYWACEQAANCAIDSEATWKAMLADDGREAAMKYIRDARLPSRMPKLQLSDAKMGTVVHALFEEYARTGNKPDRTAAEALVVNAGGPQLDVATETNLVGVMLNQFDGWLQRFTPQYIATEMTVYNPDYGYAGTLDAILAIQGIKFITDYKTTRKPRDAQGKPKTPWPDVGLQLAAYRYCEFAAAWRARRYEKQFRRYYLLGEDERNIAVRIPAVETGLCIHVTPEACEAYPVRCDSLVDGDGYPLPESVFHQFLDVQQAFRWLQETSRTVIKAPLQ